MENSTHQGEMNENVLCGDVCVCLVDECGRERLDDGVNKRSRPAAEQRWLMDSARAQWMARPRSATSALGYAASMLLWASRRSCTRDDFVLAYP